MNKRVYGVIGISSIMANWNADFSGFPKTTSKGATYGSDKALKYTMKKKWENEGEKVLYIKSMKLDADKKGLTTLIPRTLKERYEQIFRVPDLKKDCDNVTVLKNLFQAIDVKNFGATFAEAETNFSITGAVQVGQGLNKYDRTDAQEQPILSPFRDPKAKEKNKKEGEEEGEEARNSTLGTKIVSDEAHYFYPFAVNPQAYNQFAELGLTQGYQEEDYQKFKQAAISSATLFATNSKIGCENEFAMFVESDLSLYLPNLSEYVRFTKGENCRNTIELTAGDLLNSVNSRILSIEIYYNPYTTNLVTDIKGARLLNIFTGKEEENGDIEI